VRRSTCEARPAAPSALRAAAQSGPSVRCCADGDVAAPCPDYSPVRGQACGPTQAAALVAFRRLKEDHFSSDILYVARAHEICLAPVRDAAA